MTGSPVSSQKKASNTIPKPWSFLPALLCEVCCTSAKPTIPAAVQEISRCRAVGKPRKVGLKLGRLKTGTPPRINKRSIDYSRTEEQPGDPGVKFSFDDEGIPRLPQVSCHITYTTEETKQIILANIHRSPMYSGKIKGVGPRYCPSIEDKMVRFSDKERHQIFWSPKAANPRGLCQWHLFLSAFRCPIEVSSIASRLCEMRKSCGLPTPLNMIMSQRTDRLLLRNKTSKDYFWPGKSTALPAMKKRQARDDRGINAAMEFWASPLDPETV